MLRAQIESSTASEIDYKIAMPFGPSSGLRVYSREFGINGASGKPLAPEGDTTPIPVTRKGGAGNLNMSLSISGKRYFVCGSHPDGNGSLSD